MEFLVWNAIFVCVFENIGDVCGFFFCVSEGGPFLVSCWRGCCVFLFICGVSSWSNWE
jgi:hypothetical protein